VCLCCLHAGRSLLGLQCPCKFPNAYPFCECQPSQVSHRYIEPTTRLLLSMNARRLPHWNCSQYVSDVHMVYLSRRAGAPLRGQSHRALDYQWSEYDVKVEWITVWLLANICVERYLWSFCSPANKRGRLTDRSCFCDGSCPWRHIWVLYKKAKCDEYKITLTVNLALTQTIHITSHNTFVTSSSLMPAKLPHRYCPRTWRV
jgi:hypothetical protein